MHANLNVGINHVGGVAMVDPTTALDLFKLLREPAGVPPLCVVPHQDDPVGLHRRPDFDLCLAGDFPFRVGDRGAVSRLSVVLPPVEGTLQTVTNDLHGGMVNKRYT